jgi:hypothetical protein
MSEEDKKTLLEEINKRLEQLNNKGYAMPLLTMEKLDEILLRDVPADKQETLEIVEQVNKVREIIEGSEFVRYTLKDAEEAKESLVKLIDNKHIN